MWIKIYQILETERVVKQLEKINLILQYKKIKQQILDWNINFSNKLKLRNPKKDWVRYFRINKQYRALAKFIDNTLQVFEIDDHS